MPSLQGMIMPASWNQNRLTAKLGIEYPIIQGPLGGLSSQRLAAVVSNFGGLGSFGAHSLSPSVGGSVAARLEGERQTRLPPVPRRRPDGAAAEEKTPVEDRGAESAADETESG